MVALVSPVVRPDEHTEEVEYESSRGHGAEPPVADAARPWTWMKCSEQAQAADQQDSEQDLPS